MKPMNILICEDEHLFALDLKSRVEHLGHRVIGIVSNHNEAITVSRRDKPDLVLMDVYLHGRSTGLETARELETNMHIPSIFISGTTDKEILETAHKAHPLAYLTKPVTDKELELAIEFGMDQHRMIESLQKDLRLYQALFEREEKIEGQQIQSGEILRDVVGAVAHELGATLVTAITELTWLVESEGLQALEKRCVRGVIRLCEDSHKLIQRLLWASQEGPRELSIVLVTEIVHEVVDRLENWVKPISDIDLSFERDDLVVFCDRQAVVNALIGALVSFDHARSAPGPLGIAVSSIHIPSGEEDTDPSRMNDYVVISLESAHTQLGLAEVEAMTRSFAPEHSLPEHLGLGLAVAYGVVKAHGGWMEVHSDPERGAKVTLFLPQVQAH